MRAALLALLPSALAAGVASKLSSQLKSQGDSLVVSVACCGVEGSPSILRSALGAPSSAVAVVPASTPLILSTLDEVSDGAAVVGASDVIMLEVRFADLVARSAHGLALLRPLLQRAIRLRHIRKQKKLLVIAITDFEGAEIAESEVEAFVNAEMETMASTLGEGATPLSSVLQTRCFFVPYAAFEESSYLRCVDEMKASFTSPEASTFLFSDGQWSAPASALQSCLDQAAASDVAGSAQAAAPAELHVAYQCGLLAEAVTREFNKGVAQLRKTTDSALLVDFGEQAAGLLSAALTRFDAESDEYAGLSAAKAARSALEAQLTRALYPPFRKQLSALQRQSLAKFRQKLAALKPSNEIDEQLKALVKESGTTFEAQAKALVPPGTTWSYSYEKRAVQDNVAENAALHLQTLQVQGLYLPTEGVQLPVDMSVHWLGLHPFGRDSRFDPVGADDVPAFRPQAAPMSLRASEGYRPRTKRTDPKRMVFQDKMIQ